MWFDTGLKMKDGTARTVEAINPDQVAEYKAKGWKEVKEVKKAKTKTKAKTKRKR